MLRETMKSASSLTAALALLLFTPATYGFAPPLSSLPRASAFHLTPHIDALVNIVLSPDVLDASSASETFLSLVDPAAIAAEEATSAAADPTATSFLPSYSKASYYTTLALYLASFPGLWSQIKRSTKAKVKRKTYVR